MDRRTYGWFARGALAAIVLICAVACFRLGVDVSARSGVPLMGLLAQLYCAAGLFVLGGMDLGTRTAHARRAAAFQGSSPRHRVGQAAPTSGAAPC